MRKVSHWESFREIVFEKLVFRNESKIMRFQLKIERLLFVLNTFLFSWKKKSSCQKLGIKKAPNWYSISKSTRSSPENPISAEFDAEVGKKENSKRFSKNKEKYV